MGKLVNPVARSATGITGFQDFSQLCQSESDPKRPLHNKYPLHSARGIDSITRLGSRGSGENADPFIVSNRVWTHPRRLGQVPGTKSFGTAVLHHEKYQPWNAFQSQAVFLSLATIRPEAVQHSVERSLTSPGRHFEVRTSTRRNGLELPDHHDANDDSPASVVRQSDAFVRIEFQYRCRPRAQPVPVFLELPPQFGDIVAGVFTPVLAKHSKSFSLIDCISVGVDRMQRNFEPMRKQVETWQRSELTDVTAKVVIYEAFVEGNLEAPKHLARTVHDLYFEPKYEEFRPRTIWSLSNAFTSAFKELDPVPQFKATAKLGEFLEARFSQWF